MESGCPLLREPHCAASLGRQSPAAPCTLNSSLPVSKTAPISPSSRRAPDHLVSFTAQDSCLTSPPTPRLVTVSQNSPIPGLPPSVPFRGSGVYRPSTVWFLFRLPSQFPAPSAASLALSMDWCDLLWDSSHPCRCG